MVTVDPANDFNTHHLSLSDGTNTLGLILCDGSGRPLAGSIDEQANPATAMRVAQGAGGYSDFEQPYTPISQVDWAGGMGAEYVDEDASRYLDGNACDTSLGKIMPAGATKVNPAGPTYSIDIYASGGTDLLSTYEHCWSYTTGALALKRIALYMVISAACRVTWGFRIASDSGGQPGGSVDEVGVSSGTWEFTGPFTGYKVIEVVATLAAATKYWFCFHIDSITNSATMTVSYTGSSGNAVGHYTAPATWVVLHTDSTVCFKASANSQIGLRFFEYRNQVYAVTVATDGSTPRLYQGGARGAADSNAGRLLHYLMTSVTMPSGITGGTAIIIGGPGSTEDKNYRNSVLSVGGNDLFVTTPWRITHTASTEFVVTGIADLYGWVEITGHGLTAEVTDICVVDDRVYFCQGAGANVRRMVYTTGGGHAWTDEGVQADYIQWFTDTDGKKRIFMAVALTSLVYSCEIGVALSTRTQVNNSLPVGSSDSWITNIAVYDDPQRPFIMKEDGFGSVSNKVFGPIPISNAMRAVRSRKNGKAWCTNDRFLFFNMGEKIMRYYSGDLSNIGIDKDYGLPADRRGLVTDLVAYPGGVLYAAIDAGPAGYSSVLKYNNGWCEVYRAPYGERITGLLIQNIPGLGYQNLLIGQGDNIYTLLIAANPLQTTDFRYALTCSLTTGWFRTSYKDIRKFYNSLKLFITNNSANRTVLVQYRTDNNTSWSTLGTFTEAAPSQEIEFNSTNSVADDVTGTRIQLKLTLTTNDATVPVYIDQLVLETVTRIPAKRTWHVNCLVTDHAHNLIGVMDDRSAAEIKTQLETWANSDLYPQRLLLREGLEVFDIKRVFIEPASLRPIITELYPSGPREVALMARLTMIEA